METSAQSQDRIAIRLHPFDIANAAEYAEGKLKDPSAVGVKAENDQTLVVTLRHPASYFLAITTFEVTYPQRQDVIEKYDTRWTEPGNIVTNGPFRLASWKHENQIELSARQIISAASRRWTK